MRRWLACSEVPLVPPKQQSGKPAVVIAADPRSELDGEDNH
jgi:hypothetical protein